LDSTSENYFLGVLVDHYDADVFRPVINTNRKVSNRVFNNTG